MAKKPLIRVFEDGTTTWINVNSIICVVDSTNDEGDDEYEPQALFFMSDKERPMVTATYADNPRLREILDNLSRDATKPQVRQ